MDDRKEKIAQLETLVRLKELKRNKSARKLKDANKQLNLAQNKLSVAESRYQLILEVQRNMRQTGRPINPLYYVHQFDAADSAKDLMDRTELDWKKTKENRSALLAELTQEYRQLDVARNACSQAIGEYIKELDKKEMDDCYEQQMQKIGSDRSFM